MKRLSMLAILGTILAITPSVFAETSLKAVPFSSFQDVVFARNFKEFLSTFSVVERESKYDFDRFSLERKGYGIQSSGSWMVEVDIVPEVMEITYDSYFSSGGYHQGRLDSFLITLNYYPLQKNNESESETEAVIKVFVIIKLDAAQLSNEQANTLINSINTKQTVHLKGELSFYRLYSNLKELKDKLSRMIFRVIEFNGVSVYRSNPS